MAPLKSRAGRFRHLRIAHDVAPDDDDVAFGIQVFESYDQLSWCLPHLRGHYPSSRVMIIADGDGHRYARRLLGCLLSGPERYLFRLDPDALVWRRFTSLPRFSCMFGTIETLSEAHLDEVRFPPNLQGGCIGLTRDVASEILGSRLLTKRNCSVAPESTWARCRDMQMTVNRGAVSDDFLLTWAAGELGIPIVDSPEIRSRWRRTPSNDNRRYAVTHPHKV
jgi:hypothetical protein